MRPFFALLLIACDPEVPPAVGVELVHAWNSEVFDGCVLASPLEHEGSIVLATGDGRVVLIDPNDGTVRVNIALPHPDGEIAHVIATPAIVGQRLIALWQVVVEGAPDPAAASRSAHHVAVIDLERGEIDPAFPIATLAAARPSADGTGDVPFLASNALSRARLIHTPTADRELGLVYVSFGNARDIQPWHGWIFEIDLDAWRAGDDPIASVLLTTASNDCGIPGSSGALEMICGGGVWSPAGPLLVPTESSFELIVPTGNGALDPTLRSFAHTLMRIRGPGLAFDPTCDAEACADWDPISPSPECIESCRDLFVPRLRDGDPPFDAPGCEGLTFFECYAINDWDLGANTPARVEVGGRALYLLPAKDGGIYLVDGDHFGTLHDRIAVNEPCGSDGANCEATWAGSMVTSPQITELDGSPLAIVATFMMDDRHEAGVVAVRVEMGEAGPRLSRVWSYPEASTPDAVQRFRRHPSAIRLFSAYGVEYAAIVEQGRLGEENGVLHLLRTSDGALAHRAELMGPGQRFAQPLAIGSRLFMPSCDHGNAGPSHVEAWDIAEVAR